MPHGAAITVVIPTRDRPEWLARAVALALAQRDVDVRVVVVDDGSVDADAVARAVGTDPRLDLVALAGDRHGVAAARNEGLARAESPFVAFLDDDDVWHPDWLSTAGTALRRDGTDAVIGSVALIDEAGTPLDWERAPDPARISTDLETANVVGVPSQVVLRTRVVREAGGWNPNFSALADWELWLRLRDRAFAVIDRVLVGYTLHPQAMHLRAPEEMFAELDRLRDAVGLLGTGDAAFRRWVAHECLLYGDRERAARIYRDVGLREHSAMDLARSVRLGFPSLGIRRRLRTASRQPWYPAAVELGRLARESASQRAHVAR